MSIAFVLNEHLRGAPPQSSRDERLGESFVVLIDSLDDVLECAAIRTLACQIGVSPEFGESVVRRRLIQPRIISVMDPVFWTSG
jgi:hypothetical protein